MAADPLTAGIDLVQTVIARIWPDKTDQEKQQLAATVALIQGQLAIDNTEAGNTSVFVSGWRPFVGWVCGVACAWNWIGIPVAGLALKLAGQNITLGMADLTQMMPLLMGLLGMGTLRTVEKINGVAAT
jgi:hypothetical protein